MCLALLEAGAGADLVDSQGQSVIDILFYLKYSGSRVHREASAGYSCMDLYGMVNRFQLGGLLTDELREEAHQCGTCRYLLASVPTAPVEEELSQADEQPVAASESESEPSSSHRMSVSSIGARRSQQQLASLERQMHRMQLSKPRP